MTCPPDFRWRGLELPDWFDELCPDEKRDTLEDDPMPTHTLLIWLCVAWLAAVGLIVAIDRLERRIARRKARRVR